MTNNDIQTLVDKYLAGATSPQEELQLAATLQQQAELPAEWQAVSLMLGELTQGEAEYDAIIARRQPASSKPSALLIALRFISSAAAIYLVGLFIWLQLQPAPKAQMAYTPKVEQSQPAPNPHTALKVHPGKS